MKRNRDEADAAREAKGLADGRLTAFQGRPAVHWLMYDADGPYARGYREGYGSVAANGDVGADLDLE